MMSALHILAESWGQYSLYDLPPRPCAQIGAAQKAYDAWETSRQPGENVIPNWGAPVACGDPVVSRSP